MTLENEQTVSSKELEQKISQRGGYRSYITRTLKNVADLIRDFEEEKVPRLRSLQKGLEEKAKLLLALDEQIVSLLEGHQIEEDIVKASDIQDDINEALFAIEQKLLTTEKHAERDFNRQSFSPLGAHSIHSDSNSSQTTNNAGIKLPTLSLPKFEGNLVEFHSFWDSFKAAVHDNNGLENITKFTYLKSFLRGPALAAISGLSLTSDNYSDAIDILEKRYGNTQALVSTYIDKLLSLTPVTSEKDVQKLRTLFDIVEVNIRNLRSMNIETAHYGPVLISIVMSKIPNEIKLIVSRAMGNDDKWDIDRLLASLKSEIESRELCFFMKTVSTKDDSMKKQSSYTTSALLTETEQQVTSDKQNCVYCKGEHSASKCSLITNTKTRKSILRNKARCFVCIRSGHRASDCKTGNRCYRCNGRHHISICESNNNFRQRQTSQHEGQNNVLENNSVLKTNTNVTNSNSTTFLQTATAIVMDANSSSRKSESRILFDNCSQKSFITTDLKCALNLPTIRRERMIVRGFGSDEEIMRELEVVRVSVWNKNLQWYRVIDLYAVPYLCSPICGQNIDLAKATYEHLIDLELADCTNGSNELKVDILIGADFYWDFMLGEVRSGEDGPVAVKTGLGWVLSGVMEGSVCVTAATVSQHVLEVLVNPVGGDDRLYASVQKFWDLESVGVRKEDVTPRDLAEEFDQSIEFDGKNYVVKLPWKDVDAGLLPDNYSLCKGRLNSLVKRLKKKPDMLKEYDSIISTQEKEGIIESENIDEHKPAGEVHYIPHREVVREDKDTSKLRIVYDASAKQGESLSLNDMLETGPSLLPKMFDILIQFRSYQYDIASDNAKTFMGPEVRNYLRIMGCRWGFILERLPWWGGFWQKLVQMPRQRWRLAMVKSLSPRKDGQIRGCVLQTVDGRSCKKAELRRPVNQLHHFEVNFRDEVEQPTSRRKRRQAAVTGEVRRRFN